MQCHLKLLLHQVMILIRLKYSKNTAAVTVRFICICMLLSAPVFDGHIMFLRPRALNHTADANFKKRKAYSEVVTNQGLGIHILMPHAACVRGAQPCARECSVSLSVVLV